MIRAKIEWPVVSRRALVFGFVLAALLAASLLLTARPAHADLTFTVNSVGDPGSGGCNSSECTLREAIALANRVAGADTIELDLPADPNVPGNEAKTILPPSQLPAFPEQLTIDGYSQPGSRPNSRATDAIDALILVELNGVNSEAGDGLEIAAPNVLVRGLAISLFPDDGIKIRDGAQGARIEGNFIGTNAAGT